MSDGSWFYDDLAGWLRPEDLDHDVPLHIFNEVAAEIFGPPPGGVVPSPAPVREPACAECTGAAVIVGVTDSGRHHRVEPAV